MKHRGKIIKKNKQSISEQSNIIGVPQKRRERRVRKKNIWKNKCWNFPNLLKKINLQIQGKWTQHNKHENTKPKHIIIKLLKIRNKNTILSVCRESKSCICSNKGNDDRFFNRNNENKKSSEWHLQTTENKQQNKQTKSINLEFYTKLKYLLQYKKVQQK